MPDDRQRISSPPANPNGIAVARFFQEHEREIARSIRIARTWRSVLSKEDILQDMYRDILANPRLADQPIVSLRLLKHLARRNLVKAVHSLERTDRLMHGARESHLQVGDDVVVDYSAPDQPLETDQVRSLLQDALDQLPEEYRIILRLGVVGGMSHVRIAQHLGRKVGWVNAAAHAARTALQRSLVGQVEFERAG